ncbi:MAG: RNA-directed DNA polymerase [Actinomycetota bacterium]|nr:RNA-directed DNA polymerase [Actinomycetota bacterium]
MRLDERMFFHALITTIVPDLKRSIADPTSVFGPLLIAGSRRWADFEKAPLANEPKYVAKVDVYSFYETVDHGVLWQALIDSDVDETAADLVRAFLQDVSPQPRGLPQGLLASDALATAYLGQLDKKMIDAGIAYYRRGDDIRIAANTYSRAKRAVAEIERELRALGLLLNEAKTFVMKRQTYEKNLTEMSDAESQLREAIIDEAEEHVRSLENVGEVEEFLVQQGVLPDEEAEELLWDVYHEAITVDQLIEAIRDRLDPEKYVVASRLFSETLQQAPTKGTGLPLDVFNRRVTAALVALSVAQDKIALPQVDGLLWRYPWLTEVTCNYLAAMAKTTERRRVVTMIEAFLLRNRFRHDWQEAWLIYTLLPHSKAVSPDLVEHLEEVIRAKGPSSQLSKAYGARLLARRGKLTRARFDYLWRSLHSALMPDLVEAARILFEGEDWPSDYISSFRKDPLLARVVERP